MDNGIVAQCSDTSRAGLRTCVSRGLIQIPSCGLGRTRYYLSARVNLFFTVISWIGIGRDRRVSSGADIVRAKGHSKKIITLRRDWIQLAHAPEAELPESRPLCCVMPGLIDPLDSPVG